MRMLLISWLTIYFTICSSGEAFSSFTARLSHVRPWQQRKDVNVLVLRMNNMSTQFDVTKPVFDLFSMKKVRGDALLKYNSLNQSEPLRINIWGLLALTFFASPWLAIELNDEALTTTGISFAVLGAIGSGSLFLRECRKRKSQLTRLEKELNALSLQVSMPQNKLADFDFQKPQSLKNLVNKSSQTARFIAICGTAEQLSETLLMLRALGRRLVQASAYVVVVPTDGSSREDYGIESGERLPWLTEAAYPQQWQEYFDNISPEGTTTDFRWFGVSSVGRSFGSGSGQSPEWLQILGQHLRPTELLDENAPPHRDESGVLAQQNRFYEALTTGNLVEMKRVCSQKQASVVSDVINQGGRLDAWEVCLLEDARPAGMKRADADVLVVSDALAYSTVVEFPVTSGMDDATLLAMQTWRRSCASDKWELSLHRTIPWSADRPAAGTLLCDCRGCVALLRGADRRTFGGLIG